MPKNENKKVADALLKEAYQKYYSSVYRFCLSRLKNDRDSVDDCVQEAYIALYKKYTAGETIEFVNAFLLQAASNFVKKRYKELERQQTHIDLEEVKYIPSQNEDIDDRLTFEEYSRQISAALNDTDAALFSLRYVEEFKIDEIAERMEMSVPAVTTRLSRLRKKLQKLLGDEFRH